VTFVLSLLKHLELRSERAIGLIAEFLDMDGGRAAAEHFVHGACLVVVILCPACSALLRDDMHVMRCLHAPPCLRPPRRVSSLPTAR
jgi:hypothetical protein